MDMSQILLKGTCVFVALLFVGQLQAQSSASNLSTPIGLDQKLLVSIFPKIKSETVNQAMTYVQRKKAKFPKVPIIGLTANPAQEGHWKVEFFSPASCKSLICLYNQNEQIIVQEIFTTEQGKNTFELNLSHCPKGEYLVKVCTEDEVFLGMIAKAGF